MPHGWKTRRLGVRYVRFPPLAVHGSSGNNWSCSGLRGLGDMESFGPLFCRMVLTDGDADAVGGDADDAF